MERNWGLRMVAQRAIISIKKGTLKNNERLLLIYEYHLTCPVGKLEGILLGWEEGCAEGWPDG